MGISFTFSPKYINYLSVLGSFPVLLTLSTAATLCVSWLITKSGSIRYLFGLQTKPHSFLPGSRLGGFSPLIVLILLYMIVMIFGNIVNYINNN